MKKEILLVNPYTPASFDVKNRYIPLGLMYLASILIKSGCPVKLKDIQNETLGMDEDKIDDYLNNTFTEYLKTVNPDFIGIGVLFSLRFNPVLKIARIIKMVFEDIPIVLGGAHPTLFPKAILEEYKYIEYIVMGEGERSIIKLLNAHFKDKNLLSEINGIAYRKDGQVLVNPKSEYIKNLDDIPFPAYETINIKDYYFDTSDWHNPKDLPINYNFPIITSRGCPSRCTYCALRLFHGQKYRVRSPKNITDEIRYIYDKYNCRYVSFIDDNMTLSKKRTLEIMGEICKSKLNIQFDTSNGLRIDTLDEEVMDVMTEAGLIRATVGIETGSEYIRNVVLKKNLKDETIYNFFEMVKKYKDLRFVGFFMCGFPQETKKTLNDTFEMVKKIPFSNIQMWIMIPFYGTEIFKFCYEKGLLNVDIRNLHNTSDFSYEDVFFIRPFKLEISYIRDFRNKILAYVKEREFMQKIKEAKEKEWKTEGG